MPDKPNADKTTTQVQNVRQTTDVLDINGNPINSTVGSLADIFDKIEGGQKADSAVKEVMGKKVEEPKPEPEEKAAPDTETVAKPAEDETKSEEQSGDMFSAEEKKKDQSDETKPDQEAEAKPEQEAVEEDEVPEEEQAVLPHDKPKTARRIQALLKRIETATQAEANTKKQVEERDAKLKELQAELEKVKTVDPLTNDKVKEQLSELQMYRRQYALDKDPELKAKYDGRIEDAEKSIKATLMRRGAGEALIKLIDEEGGWLKFAKSDRVIRIQDGSDVPAYELAEKIKEQLPAGDRQEVHALEIEQIQTNRDKRLYIESEMKAAADFFKKQEENEAALRKKQEDIAQSVLKQADEWKNQFVEKNEFFKEPVLPENATAEQKAAHRESVEFTKQLHQVLNQNMHAKDFNAILEIVGDSVRYHAERNNVAKLQSEVVALRKQLDTANKAIATAKKGGSSVPRSGSLTGGGGAAPNAETQVKKPQSLEAALDVIESGQEL